MGIGNRIKEARLNLGYTQEELAKMLGVTKGAVANYEIETSHPKEPIMYKLFDALKVDANYLFQDEMGSNYPMKVSYNEMEHIKKYRSLDDTGKCHIDYELNREVKRVEEQQKQSEYIKKLETPAIVDNISNIDMRLINYYYRVASAGTGQIIFDMPPTKRIEIPNTPEYRKVDYAIGVNGSSMEPTFQDGDMLLVEMTDTVDVGEIGIFRIDNESYVKKLGETALISLNPAAKNIPLNETAGCMGRVIGKLPRD